MQRLFLNMLFIFLFVQVQAQAVTELKRVGAKKKAGLDSNGWKSTGLFLLNVNQSAQSDWSSGGEKFQIGINLLLNKGIHHRKGKFLFDSYFDVELGVTEAASFNKFRKTTDRFDLTFEVEHIIGKKNHWNYGVLANINTQMFNGYNYRVAGYPKLSGFLSPGKFILSPGFDYKYTKKNSYFSFFISPLTFRWVTKTHPFFFNSSKFGVDSARKLNTEIGAYISVHYNAKLSATTNLISRADIFSNYKRQPQNVDVLLNNVLTIKISELFAASFIFDLLYDADIKARTQVQQVMGLGLKMRL